VIDLSGFMLQSLIDEVQTFNQADGCLIGRKDIGFDPMQSIITESNIHTGTASLISISPVEIPIVQFVAQRCFLHAAQTDIREVYGSDDPVWLLLQKQKVAEGVPGLHFPPFPVQNRGLEPQRIEVRWAG